MKDIQPFQQRLLDEFNDLTDKVNKLTAFIMYNPIFPKLGEEEAKDMIGQLMAMKYYQECLRSRCKRQKLID